MKDDDGIEFTDEQAEEAVMGWRVAGKLPPNWSRGTLACAVLYLAKRDNENERGYDSRGHPYP